MQGFLFTEQSNWYPQQISVLQIQSFCDWLESLNQWAFVGWLLGIDGRDPLSIGLRISLPGIDSNSL